MKKQIRADAWALTKWARPSNTSPFLFFINNYFFYFFKLICLYSFFSNVFLFIFRSILILFFILFRVFLLSDYYFFVIYLNFEEFL